MDDTNAASACTDFAFRPIQLSDRAGFAAAAREAGFHGSEYAFANAFCWRDAFDLQLGEWAGTFTVRSGTEGHYRFLCPFGANPQGMMDRLDAFCRQEGQPLALYSVNARCKAWLEAQYPGRFAFTEIRNSFDYLYDAESLISLAGKKLHAKRNHINSFFSEYGDAWAFEPMTKDNIPECAALNQQWIANQDGGLNKSQQQEQAALDESFRHFEALALSGGLLRLHGEVIAFTIGGELNAETFVVYVEKARGDLRGAYPLINQQFAAYAAKGYRYINREDDVGSEGLRKAKLSYHPAFLEEKWLCKEA